MPFDSVQQVKSRTRSIQLDQAPLPVAKIDTGEPGTQQPQSTQRITVLPSCTLRPCSSPVVSSVPETVRQFRSMLDVAKPPKLGPWNAMSFDELYSDPMDLSKSDSIGTGSDNTEIGTVVSADTIKRKTNDPYCQEPPTAIACALIHETLLHNYEDLLTTLNSDQRQWLPAHDGTRLSCYRQA